MQLGLGALLTTGRDKPTDIFRTPFVIVPISYLRSSDDPNRVARVSKQPAILMVRMVYVLTAIHVIVCLFLIIVVLLQSGQAADLAGAFGGMGSQTVFGPRGSATVLSKATTWAAITFMVTSLGLAIISGRRLATNSGSVLDNRVKPTPTAPQKRTAPPPPVSVTPTAPPSGKPYQQPNVNYSIQEPGKKPVSTGQQQTQPAQPKK